MKVDFLDLLVLLFVGLKLSGQIDWSWWWVFSPWWIAAIIILIGSSSAEQEKPKLKKRVRR